MQITFKVQRHRWDSETGGQEHGAVRNRPVRSAVKPSDATNGNPKDELIGRTREVWQPRLGRDLSREEVRQIAANVTGFFSVLAEWSRAEMPSPANDTGKANASENGEGRHDR